MDTARGFASSFLPGAAAASTAMAPRRAEPAWVPAPAPAVSRATPIGASGTTVRAGRIQFEEFNVKLDGSAGYGGPGIEGVFNQMRRTDPHIRRALQLLKLPLRSAMWIFEPADETDEAKEHADFLTHCLFERLTWDDILRQALLMYDHGFSLFEVMEAPADVPRARFPGLNGEKKSGRPAAGEHVKAITWSAIASRLPRTVNRWVPDEKQPERLRAVVQYVMGGDVEIAGYRTIPAERLLRFTHDMEGGNFAGTSILRTVYKPWRFLDELERTDIVRHIRQNIGTPVMSLPETGVQEGDVDKAERILMTIGTSERGYVVEPPGWEFRWETSGSGEGTNVGEAIQRCIDAIAANVIAGFMTLGGGDTGSYALAETQADHFLAAIEAGARFIEDVFNKGADGVSFPKRLIDLNYGPQEAYPRLKATNLKSRDYGQVIPLVAQLIQAKALTPSKKLEAFLLKRLDIEISEEDLEEAQDEQAKKDADAAKAAAAAKPAPPASGKPAEPAPKEPAKEPEKEPAS